MDSRPLVSVIVNNYNYARYVGAAIESVLGQTYRPCEVIVVDDGSKDDSRQVINHYGNRVTTIFKDNGGQASAFNAGYKAASGEIICFLDADDVYLPDTIDRAVRAFDSPEVSKAHWPLLFIDEQGTPTGSIKEPELPAGDFRDRALQFGPSSCLPSAPTSGNAWARWFLDRVMPIPEDGFRLCADSYLFTLAPALGIVRGISDPNGYFRRHSSNGYQDLSFNRKLALGVEGYTQQERALERILRGMGHSPDISVWRSHSWWPRIESSIQELTQVLPGDGRVILVDLEQWGLEGPVGGHDRFYFMERDGEYWGLPENDEAAIGELVRLQRLGATAIAFAWPAFWLLESYPALRSYLESRCERLLKTNNLIVFGLDNIQRKT
jgi:glycosyltransferase involved in cell wall biosynthesis